MTDRPDADSSVPQRDMQPEARRERALAAAADPARMCALAAYDLLNPALSAEVEMIVRRTRQRLDAQTSLVTVILDRAQYILASAGLDGWILEAQGTPIEWAFCTHAVADGETYAVPDAANDPVQSTNPLVTLDGLASYLGAPLIGSDGTVIGAHCLLGDVPRQYTSEERAELERAAEEIVAILNSYRRETGLAETGS